MNFWNQPLTRRAVIRSMIGSSIMLPGLLTEMLAEDSPADPLGLKSGHFPAKA